MSLITPRRALLRHRTTVAAASVALLATVPSMASGAAISKTWTDSCQLSMGGRVVTLPASVAYSGTAPDSVTKGGTYALSGVRQTLTFSGAAVKQLAAFGSGLQFRAERMPVRTGKSGLPSATDLIPSGTAVLSNRAAFQTDVWNPFDATKTTYKPLSITLAPTGSATFTHQLGISNLVELNAQDGLTGVFLLDGLLGQSGYNVICTGPSTNLASYTAVDPPAAAVTSITPISGPTTGGNEVTVRGPGLEAAVVRFGLYGATVVSRSSRGVVVRVPARPTTGPVTINVFVNGTTVTLPSAYRFYTYTAVPAPTISTLSPTSAPELFGTRVTATGTNLAGATAVTFNGQSVPFTQNSATSVSFDAPGLPKGAYTVAIVTPGGSATKTFTYTAWF
ncbi:MAG: IPT/TIG domain-containing protein [Solirubrobacteraceae bacterium]|nr:IPT/TIG domain-containing protein [Solirubrobacteraceae bacterium]